MGKSSYKLNSPVNNDGQNITPWSRNMEKVKELLNALFVKPEDGDDAFHVHKDRADGNKVGIDHSIVLQKLKTSGKVYPPRVFAI